MKRVIAFIDGYNVYHSVAELGPDFNHLKWLDLDSLVRALIHPKNDVLEGIEYFTADAHWNAPEKRQRHFNYISALKIAGVNTHIGSFKRVTKTCAKCQKSYKAYEENGTDVAIAAKMVEFAHNDEFDKALLFSADSDLVPIVESIRNSHPDKEIFIVTTSSRIRFAKNLRSKANGYIELDKSNFERNLFGQQVVGEGNLVTRPQEYGSP